MAHPVDGATPAAWPWTWQFEPWVLACLAASGFAYAIGTVRLWRQAGRGRGISPMQAGAFWAGWATLILALVSPLDQWGTLLFSAHMVQHELFMVLAAPLLVMGHPLAAWAWALPFNARRAVGRWTHHPAWRRPWQGLTTPLSGWLLHGLALWAWHVPALFDAALQSTAVHTLQHVSFLGTALIFWWSVLRPASRHAQGAAMAYLFTTMVHTGALGALLTLSPSVWYGTYLNTTTALGLDPLEDQQLGGLVMWVPAGFSYFAAGLVLAANWIGPRQGPLTSPAASPDS
ncbi:MAG: cytochrome c oxidase assembly protein [Rubrivivax sp.]|nr:MAG: cytochrome c oxidase assembly protein [Rubrivivax sp.]